MFGSLVLTLLIFAQQPPAGTPPSAADKPWPPAGVIRLDKTMTPPKIIRQIKPRYTEDARRAKIQGVVHVDAVVKTDGTVGETRVTRSLDTQFGLDQRAVEALKEWRFAPGQKEGVAVPVLVEIELTFTLR
jgi:TonB family protein